MRFICNFDICMLSDHNLQFTKPLGLNFDQTPKDEIPFLEKDYYLAFLKELGVNEKKDYASYTLMCQGNRDWTICLEDVSVAMQNMQNMGDLSSDRKSVV